MPRLRVLIVDDSAAIRHLLALAIEQDPKLELAGSAGNGRTALALLGSIPIDVVVLDQEMPDLDGIGVLRILRERQARLPVIMFSAHTQRGAQITVEALMAGASDYVTKPDSERNAAGALEWIKTELLPRIKVLGRREQQPLTPLPVRASVKNTPPISSRRVSPEIGASLPSPPERLSWPRPPDARVDVVAIGASTGGPSALASLLSTLPATMPVPIVVVQHATALFTRAIAEQIASYSRLALHEAKDGDRLEPGGVWLAPGGMHLVAKSRRELQVNADPPENSCRPSVDVLFRSLPRVFGPNVLGVVLTGMGEDGVAGSRSICEAGGQVIVQDRETSLVWGMPGRVAAAGLASRTLPLDELAAEILLRVRPAQARSDAVR